MDRLSYLPTELLRQILTLLTVHDLSCLRLTSKKLCLLSDHPSHWRHIRLSPPTQDRNEAIDLWQVTDLQRLIGPHRQLIESIQIWGVRDNIVRYIMSNCANLTDLTVCGWVTLSDHAFKCFSPKIHRLVLLDAPNHPNYTALDAMTLTSLLIRCPLDELVIKCKVHIHAQTLINEISRHQFNSDQTVLTKPGNVKSPSADTTLSTFNKFRHGAARLPLRLERLVLATRRTWSTEHVMALFDLCPSLLHVSLCPNALTECMNQQDMTIHRSIQ